MKPQFKHYALTSFFMWYDHTFITNAEAFVNKTSIKLFPQVDDRLPTAYTSYASQFKSWVADESIVGAVIAKDAVFRDDANVIIDPSNYSVDYQNGRILFDSTETYAFVTCEEVAVKESNTYFTNDSEEDIILEKQKDANDGSSNYPPEADETPIKPYDQVIPASFLSLEGGMNIPYAIGGEDQTQMDAKAVVMTKDPYQLDCVLGVFEDSVRVTIPLLDFDDVPFDEFGELLSDYNYADLKTDKDQFIFIERVVSSKVQDVVRKKVAPSFYVGFLDFELTISRFPRG